MERKQLATAVSKPPATKSSRSKFWFVRIDGPKEFLTEKCKVLAGQIDVSACLAAFHVGDKKENPHTHIVIELTSEPQKQSFAVRLKGLFAIEKKSQYALDVWDGKRGAGACSYLFHEDNVEILVNKGHSDEDIALARAANDAVKRVVAVNKEKASTKFVDKALEHFADSEPSERDLLSYMMGLCRSGDLYWPGTFRAKQMIEEVRIRMSADIERLVDEFHFKIFR